MWHIYKTLKGNLEFAFIKKGNYICGSGQSYSSKATVFRTIAGMYKNSYTRVQDNTIINPKVFTVQPGRKPVQLFTIEPVEQSVIKMALKKKIINGR
jgi:hypothetical protein